MGLKYCRLPVARAGVPTKRILIARPPRASATVPPSPVIPGAVAIFSPARTSLSAQPAPLRSSDPRVGAAATFSNLARAAMAWQRMLRARVPMCVHVEGFLMQRMVEKSMSKRVQIAGKELRVITVEAQEIVWRLAPRDWIGKRKAAIAGVARRLGWEFARTWNIAHGRARRIDADEMDRLRAELEQLEQGAMKRWETLDGLEARIAQLRGTGSQDHDGSRQGTAAGSGRGSGTGTRGHG